jgi:hypothetical protein
MFFGSDDLPPLIPFLVNLEAAYRLLISTNSAFLAVFCCFKILLFLRISYKLVSLSSLSLKLSTKEFVLEGTTRVENLNAGVILWRSNQAGGFLTEKYVAKSNGFRFSKSRNEKLTLDAYSRLFLRVLT